MSYEDTDQAFTHAIQLVTRLSEISLLAAAEQDIDAILEGIVDEVLQETGADYASIGLVDDRRQEVFEAAGALPGGRRSETGARVPITGGVVGRVATTGEAVSVHRTAEVDEYVAFVDGMQSELAVPLKIGDRVLGVLNVESGREEGFSARDRTFLEALATPVALAVRAAKLLAEQRRHAHKLQILTRISRILTSTTDVDVLLQRTVDAIREMLGCDLVAIGFYSEMDDLVELHTVSSDEPIDMPIGYTQALGEGVTGEVVRSGRSLLVSDVRERENYVPADEAFRCELCCPLIELDGRGRGRVFGYLDAETREPHGLGQDDLLLLSSIAEHISQAVGNARRIAAHRAFRDEMSGMIVHDLRNPLTVVRSTLSLLGWSARQVGSQGADWCDCEALEEAEGACEGMAVLLDSILQLQKMEAGSLVLSLQELSPAALVESVTGRMGVVARLNQQELRYRVSSSLPPLMADEHLLIRVLENLLTNALKFTPPGGVVEVSVDTAADREGAVWFRVRDEGPGIPQHELERIFEKFEVVESYARRKRHSVGLGLAFCKRAVHAHGGAIWAESEAGAGSVFHVLVPAA